MKKIEFYITVAECARPLLTARTILNQENLCQKFAELIDIVK